MPKCSVLREIFLVFGEARPVRFTPECESYWLGKVWETDLQNPTFW